MSGYWKPSDVGVDPSDYDADNPTPTFDPDTGKFVPGAGGGGGAAFDVLVGDGTAVTFDVAHDLGTSAIVVAAWEVASGDKLSPSWLILNDNEVRVTFGTAPGADDVRVVVLASGGEVSGGSSGIWEHIETGTVASGTIDITSIDAAYTAFRLLLRWSGGSGDATFVVMRLNNDSGGSSYQIDRPAGTASRSELVFYDSSATADVEAGQMAGTITQPTASAPALFTTERIAHGNPQQSAWGTGRWVNGSSQKVNRITVLTTVGTLAAGSKLILEGTRE